MKPHRRAGKDRSSTPEPAHRFRGGLSALATAAMLLAGLGCAGQSTNQTGTGPDRPADRTAGPNGAGPHQPLAVIDDADLRRDPIRAFREPAYAIDGRPAVLFPVPPGDLTTWWLPAVPELREPGSGRPLNASLVWLAASAGGATRSDALAWLTGANALGAARWSSLPAGEAERLAGSASETDRALLGDSGLWVMLVEGLRQGESIALVDAEGNQGARLGVRWLSALPAGASDLSPLHPPHWGTLDRAASARLGESLGSAWRDPLQRWRVRLLADRFAGDGAFVTPLGGDADPVVDEIAAQFERLWREALGTLLASDAPLAAEVFGALLPIVELAPGVPLPVWRADAGAESALLAAMLDERAAPDRIRGIARAIRESRTAAIGWIEQDAEPIDDGFDQAVARARAAELHGRARRATVEGGLATTPGTEVPGLGTAWFAIDLGPSPDAASRPLTLRSGALSQPMAVAPRAAPVLPPRFTINPLWRAWTGEAFLSGLPAPALAVRGERFMPAAAAILTRDAVNRRWVLFVECLRDPAATRGDEIRIWFDTPMPIVVDSSGALRDARGRGDEIELLAHEMLSDRWSATVAFRDAPANDDERADAENADEELSRTIRFALQRTERLATGGTRTSSWPRPKFPGESPDTPPSTIGLDLAAWDRELDSAASFDGPTRDDPRGREAFDAWRTDEPLPGPIP